MLLCLARRCSGVHQGGAPAPRSPDLASGATVNDRASDTSREWFRALAESSARHRARPRRRRDALVLQPRGLDVVGLSARRPRRHERARPHPPGRPRDPRRPDRPAPRNRRPPATRGAAHPQQERRVALVRDDRHELPREPCRARHRHQRARHHRPQGRRGRAHRAHAARPADRSPEPPAPDGPPFDRAGAHRARERHDRGVVLRPRRVQGRERLGRTRRWRPGARSRSRAVSSGRCEKPTPSPGPVATSSSSCAKGSAASRMPRPSGRASATSSSDRSRSTTSKPRCR